ncbi:hypothetical protein GCM10027422_23280 [Hymenobacter arcticus]
MGQAKKIAMEQEEYSGVTEFLEELLRRHELNGALAGVAKQVIDKGPSSMSERQKEVMDGYIESYKSKYICSRCDNDNVTSLMDYTEIADEGMCYACQNDLEKIMRD